MSPAVVDGSSGLTVDQYGAPVNWSGSISSVRPGGGGIWGARALGKGHRTSERPVTEGHLVTPTRSRRRPRPRLGGAVTGRTRRWTAHEPEDHLPGADHDVLAPRRQEKARILRRRRFREGNDPA